jgi:pilus assembly protein CpaE
LREALDHPERVDELFLERGMTRVGERLGVLAALEPLEESFTVDAAAVHSLLEHLLHRYRYVFVDVPASAAPGLTQVLHLPATTLLVSTASLVCARDVARLRARLVIPNAREIASASRLGAKGLQKCSALQRSLAPLLRQLSGEGFGTERRSLLRRFLR